MQNIGKYYNSYFPKLFRQLLKEYNISQYKLAEYIGITRQALAKYRDGKTTPDIYTFEKIVRYFKEEKRS